MKTWLWKERMHRLRVFVTRDIWEIDLSDISWLRRPVVKLLRIVDISIRGFRDDELPLRASGLTFVTLLSIAPLLAFVFAIFGGMGRGQEMIARFRAGLAEMPLPIQEFLETILLYVENTSKVGIGGVAVLVLLYTVIKVMSNIELSFNKVWGVTSSRTLLRKFTDYVSTLVLVPMFILAASALAGLKQLPLWTDQLQAVYTVTDRLLVFAPLFTACLGFAMLYMVMPNTRVRLKPALVSGLIAAVLWGGWQVFYIRFQAMLLGRQDKIFGAFASVPIFMLYLYVCWVIVLFGAEIAFAMQNYPTFAEERKAGRASQKARLLTALAVVREAGRAMAGEASGFRADVFAKERRVPIKLLNDVIQTLCDAGLMAGLAEDSHAYALVRSPDRVSVKEVIDAMLEDGAPPRQVGLHRLDESVAEMWNEADHGMADALAGRTFCDPPRPPRSDDGAPASPRAHP